MSNNGTNQKMFHDVHDKLSQATMPTQTIGLLIRPNKIAANSAWGPGMSRSPWLLPESRQGQGANSGGSEQSLGRRWRRAQPHRKKIIAAEALPLKLAESSGLPGFGRWETRPSGDGLGDREAHWGGALKSLTLWPGSWSPVEVTLASGFAKLHKE